MGSLLLEAAEQWAQSTGVKHLVLHVHEDNTAARRFYDQAGFVAVSRGSWWATALLGMKRRLLMAKELGRQGQVP